MKSSQTRKEENRRLILDAAARLFRERGIHGVSVAEVMQAADMTHGGFYRHFADKDDLVAHAVAAALDPLRDGRGASPADDPSAFAASYLSAAHRDHAGAGCVYAALGPEVVRGSPSARHVMTEAMRRQFEQFARSAAGRGDAERRQTAIVNWATMLGAVLLSRISDDPALADEILDTTRSWVTSRQKPTRENGTSAAAPSAGSRPED